MTKPPQFSKKKVVQLTQNADRVNKKYFGTTDKAILKRTYGNCGYCLGQNQAPFVWGVVKIYAKFDQTGTNPSKLS